MVPAQTYNFSVGRRRRWELPEHPVLSVVAAEAPTKAGFSLLDYNKKITIIQKIYHFMSYLSYMMLNGLCEAQVVGLQIVSMATSGITLSWLGVPSNLNGGVLPTRF